MSFSLYRSNNDCCSLHTARFGVGLALLGNGLLLFACLALTLSLGLLLCNRRCSSGYEDVLLPLDVDTSAVRACSACCAIGNSCSALSAPLDVEPRLVVITIRCSTCAQPLDVPEPQLVVHRNTLLFNAKQLALSLSLTLSCYPLPIPPCIAI